MILRTSPASPFGRKVQIIAALVGLTDRLEIIAADTNDPADVLREQNPLGKIPTLVLSDGTSYYDSRVIVEYLDFLAGGDVVIPADPAIRFRTLTKAALADGIADASLLQIYEERLREPAARNEKWLANQADKVARGLAAFEGAPPEGRRDVAHVALACALGYLDLRFHGAWRETRPRLAHWLAGFAADVPAFAATAS
ncbi:glutathione S-transferase N-terminal domain-containing protein [Methylocapsa acidiphila]|uniref:glutathione S-transferase N-terminal domain-containing protein n=1 Tax=Methylocapsa acidiphila TaxID=133552 RepID=UPI00056AF381|nr:glutathione S-transferase N-terminal domain-containing protein [Methylocapsa acidiphila]